MTATKRIVSIETNRVRASHARAGHDIIVAVNTLDDTAAVPEKRWTVRSVLQEMNSAGHFYTEASNGRQARVQRYNCASCNQEHIRTHIGDRAIHEMMNLPRTVVVSKPKAPAVPA